jgi:hypothetical protein
MWIKHCGALLFILKLIPAKGLLAFGRSFSKAADILF